MKRKRFYPKWVSAYKDRHGKERLRFRRKGSPEYQFKAEFGTEAFGVEYKACKDGKPDFIEVAIQRTAPGTIADLVTRYMSVPTRLGPTAVTQAKIRAILSRFREKYGAAMVADTTFETIEKIIASRLPKAKVGKRVEGGVEAARKLRKELVRMFDFAIKIRMIKENPAAQSDRVKVAAGEKSTGYYTWTEADIAQYRTFHKLGTRARLAMELILWTDQRRIDAIHLGRQHIVDGYIKFRQTKTGREMEIAAAPQLVEAIVAMPGTPGMCFLLTDYGRPFSNAGFGNWFRDQCDVAGLPKCSAHGLRKATMRRMAELGFGNQTMKSVSGHVKDEEVATYTAAANQKRMAATAIRELSRWEMANPDGGLDNSHSKDVGNKV